MGLFLNSVSQYRSSLYETARNLLKSRGNQNRRAEDFAKQVVELKTQNEQLVSRVKQTQKELDQAQQLLRHAHLEIQQLHKQPITLKNDLPLPHHSYGPKMISLCINLSKSLGFRPARRALEIIFQWLQIKTEIPTWDSMRSWACRVGIAELEKPVQASDDWIWMADHSNQIGKEKVLQIIGIRASELPPRGSTLRHEDMTVLAVVPGTDWKREDVREQYEMLAKRIGPPRYLLTDGAVELRESADTLGKPGKEVIVLRDMKHYAANVFERLIGKSDRFKDYLSHLGRTRSSIQQTELSHFTPPPQKPKARFMNLGPTLRWGQMVSYHLSDGLSKSRREVSPERMNEKLGWLHGFRTDLASWNRCQDVMLESLKFINLQGLYRGASDDLKLALDSLKSKDWECCDLSESMSSQLIAFVKESEQCHSADERTWLSTEILESSFGLFKSLEGQHSKGGFTSLVAAMPTMMTDCTPELIRENLRNVTVKKMKQWVTDKLGATLASKKAMAYREFTFDKPC